MKGILRLGFPALVKARGSPPSLRMTSRKVMPSNKKPLAGWRVLVSRPKKQAGALSDELRVKGAEVLEIPFIEIRPPRSYRPLNEALRLTTEYDWLILTSVNGVQSFFEQLE